MHNTTQFCRYIRFDNQKIVRAMEALAELSRSTEGGGGDGDDDSSAEEGFRPILKFLEERTKRADSSLKQTKRKEALVYPTSYVLLDRSYRDPKYIVRTGLLKSEVPIVFI